MKIIKSSENLTAHDKYALCLSGASQKIADAKGQRLDIAAWAYYTDADRRTGIDHDILAIKTTEGDIFATISQTFISDFFRMLDFFDSEGLHVDAIKVTGGVSKNGREFVSCTIAD